MKFNIDTRKIKTRELIELEKTPSLSQTVALMSRFMVDETTGEPIAQDVAYEQLCDLTAEEIQAVQVAFMESFSPNQRTGGR
jgi:hypothetical protein